MKTGGKSKKAMGKECGSGYGITRDRQRRHPGQEERETDCYEEEVQRYWKMDYKLIIYTNSSVTIYIYHVVVVCHDQVRCQVSQCSCRRGS